MGNEFSWGGITLRICVATKNEHKVHEIKLVLPSI